MFMREMVWGNYTSNQTLTYQKGAHITILRNKSNIITRVVKLDNKARRCVCVCVCIYIS